ncbi:MAG: slipin family protein [Gammaproteobacteria bacterium]|nr:slipin family protein [Gammaproteobacteria bacterium]
MIIDFLYFQLLIVILVVMLFASMFRILREYERGVVFLLGRFYKIKGPGFIILIPFVQQMVRVDLRIVTMDVPSQDLISKDNVTVRVNAVLYFRVLDPQKAIINVENFLEATSQLAQTTMRSVLGQHELDEILSARDTLNADLQRILDQSTDNWGIKVTAVEIKHVDLDESMIRAIARQAEAERSRRAKVIHATGELEASKQLLEAARMLGQQPEAIQLRYLQTLTEISNDNSKIIVFPLPMELGQILQPLNAQSRPASPADPDSPSEIT